MALIGSTVHFNRSKKYVSLFDGKQEERLPIAALEDIYEYAERLQKTVRAYVASGSNGSPGSRATAAGSTGSG